MKPSFIARQLRDGSTAIQCRETGTRYIVAHCGNDCGTYRNGQLIFTGSRAAAINAVETDARHSCH